MVRAMPRTATKNPNDLITASLFNTGVLYLSSFTLQPPVFRGHCTTTPAIATATWTVMPLDATEFDSDSGHSNVTNNSRYTCQITGWYWVEGYVSLNTGDGTARCESGLFVNGSVYAGASQFISRTNQIESWTAGALVHLNASDYVEVAVRQNTGISINVDVGIDLAPSLAVFWVHS